jgi:hypothetical protein
MAKPKPKLQPADAPRGAVVIPFPAARIKRRPPPAADSPAFSEGLLAGLQMAKDLARRGLLRSR